MTIPVHNLTTNEALIYLPAFILYKLAFSPQMPCSVDIKESLLKDGWLKEHPAEIILSAGNYAKINGRHRLSYLNSINRLDMQVPTLFKLV